MGRLDRTTRIVQRLAYTQFLPTPASKESNSLEIIAKVLLSNMYTVVVKDTAVATLKAFEHMF